MTLVTIAVVTVVIVTYFSKKKIDTSKTVEISQGSFSRSRDVFLSLFSAIKKFLVGVQEHGGRARRF